VQALFALMSGQHGAASCAQARQLGVDRRAVRRLLRDGAIDSPSPGVLTAGGSPATFHRRAMAAALAPGVTAVSHRTAARLHRLDGFEREDDIDVIVGRSANPHVRGGAVVHRSRADLARHVTAVDGIPVLTIAATLALLAPLAGPTLTTRAVQSALARGVSTAELREVAAAWRRRGRAGPAALLGMIGQSDDDRLPPGWFRHVAARVHTRFGVRLLDGYVVGDTGGAVLVELDLADPTRRIGVADGRAGDATRRARLRQCGWDVVDVWWHDRHQPDRVIGELATLLASRWPTRR
jgi:hypothetical protein